jgi:putative Mn2+ efflux pump MntP
MNKVISLALLLGGIVLCILGIQAMNSFSSDVSRFFTGSPTDKAVWMLIGGVVLAGIGLSGTLRKSKRA